MYKSVFQLLLVTFLLNEATCFPHKHQQVISEKNPATRNPMRRFCTVKFRLIPKMISSFNTDFMMFKRPRIVCHWAKSQSEKKKFLKMCLKLQNLQESQLHHHLLQQKCQTCVLFILNLLLYSIFVIHT